MRSPLSGERRPLVIRQWRPLQGWCLAWLTAALLVAQRLRNHRHHRSLLLALTRVGVASSSFWSCVFAGALCWALPFPQGWRGRGGELPKTKDGEANREGPTRYVRRGRDPEAELVVLVHGMSTPLEVYDPMADALVASGFETLAFDWYGRGWSSGDDSLSSVPLITAQLEDLLTALPIPEDRRFHIVGLSMGGPIVSAFAARHPQRIRSIIWIAPLVKLQPLREMGRLATWAPQIASLLYGRTFDGKASFRQEIQQWDRHKEWYEKFEQEIIGSALEQNEAVRRGVASSLYAEILAPAQQGDLERHWAMHVAAAGIGVPILLIGGVRDASCQFSDQKRLAESLPEVVELLGVEEAGHYPNLDEREMVNERVVTFFRGAASARPVRLAGAGSAG